MKVKELSEIIGLRASKIRYYERENLICSDRKKNNYRDLSDLNATDILLIQILRNAGMSLGDVKQYIYKGNNFYDEWIDFRIEELNREIEMLGICKNRLVSLKDTAGGKIEYNKVNYVDDNGLVFYNLWVCENRNKTLDFDKKVNSILANNLLNSYIAIKIKKQSFYEDNPIDVAYGYGIREDVHDSLKLNIKDKMEIYPRGKRITFYFECDNPCDIQKSDLSNLIKEIKERNIVLTNDFIGRIYAKNQYDGFSKYSVGIHSTIA